MQNREGGDKCFHPLMLIGQGRHVRPMIIEMRRQDTNETLL